MKWIYFNFFMVVLAGTTFGQNISVSPYSSFGVGEVTFDNNVEQSGMGGINAVNINPYGASANFSNPAANRYLKLTTFEASANTYMSKFKDTQGSSQRNTTYLSNLSLAFPVGEKSRMGIGFQPYTSIGYNVTTITEGDESTFANNYEGDGGINSLHAMYSYDINDNFSVGLRANYLFGDINRSQKITTEGLALIREDSYNNTISGFQFTTGATYTKKLANNKHFDIGATYTLGASLNSKVESLTSTYALLNLNPINVDTLQYNNKKVKTKLPQMVSVATSYGKDLNWMIGAQLDWANWANFSLEDGNKNVFDTQFKAAVGGYWIPDFNSYKSYFERVTYRLGAFYEATPLEINEEGIKKFGITFGFGLPVGKSGDASMLNIGVELGKRGNTNNGIIQENYANLKLGFTLNDIWFRKRVID